jgi:hypothetical protein
MKALREEIPNIATCESVEAGYERRLSDLNRGLSSAQRRRSVALAALLGCTILLILSCVSGGHFRFRSIAAIPAFGIMVCLHEYAKSQRAATQNAIRCGFYAQAIDRVQLNWDALERTGKEFAPPAHPYQSDLQILGERSLFSLLCTTRSEAGAARLASYLLDPVDLGDAKARQEAVQELRALTSLREEIALLGKYQFQGCDPDALRGG